MNTTINPRDEIRRHLTGDQWQPTATVRDNITQHNLRCLAGMIETGEIKWGDIRAVGGDRLAGAVGAMLGDSAGPAAAIRKVTAIMQTEIESGRRSARIDAHDLIEVLLSIAEEIEGTS